MGVGKDGKGGLGFKSLEGRWSQVMIRSGMWPQRGWLEGKGGERG